MKILLLSLAAVLSTPLASAVPAPAPAAQPNPNPAPNPTAAPQSLRATKRTLEARQANCVVQCGSTEYCCPAGNECSYDYGFVPQCRIAGVGAILSSFSLQPTYSFDTDAWLSSFSSDMGLFSNALDDITKSLTGLNSLDIYDPTAISSYLAGITGTGGNAAATGLPNSSTDGTTNNGNGTDTGDNTSGSGGKKSNTAAIAGGVAGGVVVLALVAGGIIMLLRKKKNKDAVPADVQQPFVPPPPAAGYQPEKPPGTPTPPVAGPYYNSNPITGQYDPNNPSPAQYDPSKPYDPHMSTYGGVYQPPPPPPPPGAPPQSDVSVLGHDGQLIPPPMSPAPASTISPQTTGAVSEVHGHSAYHQPAGQEYYEMDGGSQRR